MITSGSFISPGGSWWAGRDRLYHWRIAYGSAREADSHLQLLIGAGVVDAHQARVALDLLDQVRAMIWSLLHPAV